MATMAKPWAAALFLTALVLGLAPAAPASAASRSGGWSVQVSPNPPGAISSQLLAVACPQPAACFAVGYSYAKSAGHTLPLAERWNGTAWTLLPIPTLPKAGRTFLNGISCAAANRCIAVGFAVTTSAPFVDALAEAWNGTKWAIQATPQPGSGAASFNAVSCTAAGSCMAVGGFSAAQDATEQPLTERWNGSGWAIVPAPSPQPDNYGSGLDAVSCTAASACTAVGSYFVRELADFVFAARWNGSRWATQRQPNPGVQKLDEDLGVACASASACTSVGYWTTFSASFQQPLAEAWNGGTWARQRTPQPAGNHLLTLNGVSCASTASCIAVGNWSPVAGGGIPTYSVAERWNGTAWAVQDTPSPAGSKVTTLNGVACTSAAQCVAVGSFSTATRGVTLVERYTR
jgi:hypothetical protein